MLLKCFLKNPVVISDGEIRHCQFVEQIDMRAVRIPQTCFPRLTSISNGGAGLRTSSRQAQKPAWHCYFLRRFLLT